jgi:hypothetical protein
MLDTLRTSLYRVITTPRGDGFAPVRIPKDLARRANALLGQPLCSPSELEIRRAAETKLASLRAGTAVPAKTTNARKEAVPVMVYFEKDRNKREQTRIEELLLSKSIAFTGLDVAGDEATQVFVTRQAKCELDDLPIVFIAGKPIGGYKELVEADVCGDLKKALAG